MAWVHDLARWVADLQGAHVPQDVLRTAALQHLSTAASLRAAGGPPDRGDLRALASALAGRGSDDYAYFGHPTPGAVLAAWVAGDEPHAARVATVAANEVAGRVGAWTLLQRAPREARVYVTAVAAAVARGVSEGAGAEAIAAAVARVLGHAEVLPRAALHDEGARAEAVAGAVVTGWEALDARGPAPDLPEDTAPGALDCPLPLPRMLGDLGRTWLTRALVHRVHPGAPGSQAALAAWDDLLHRYVRAAGENLDADLVAGVQVGVDHATWRATRRDLRPGPFSLPWLLARRLATGDAAVDLARRIEVRPDPALTATWVRGAARLVRDLRAGREPEPPPRPARLVLHTTTGGRWTAARERGAGGPWEDPAARTEGVLDKLARAGGSPARGRLFLDLPPARLEAALGALW